MTEPPSPPAATLWPDKKSLVRQLLEVSRLLEVLGAEPYRAAAYAGAARRLEAYEGDLTPLLEAGRLTEVRGVGPGVAAAVEALRGRGAPQLPLLEALYAEVPEGVLGLLRVAGLGPKKVRALWQAGIADLDALLAAAGDGRLAKVRGFGAKSAAAVTAAARFALEARERERLDEAEVRAARFEALCKTLAPEATLERAGELRRALETVGALSFVVTGLPVTVLAERLASLGATPSEGGELHLSFEGRPLELWCADAEALGAALACRTGSEAFVAALAAHAAAKGLRLTPAGLLRGETLLPTPTEAALWTQLGLPMVPPERREGGLVGDEALVTLTDIRGLVHNHTTWSDGACSLDEMVAAARALGYRYLALADHSRTSYYANGLSVERVFEQARAVARLREALDRDGADFKVLHGLEVDILPDGSLDYPDEVLAKLDYTVISVHQHFTLDKVKQTERLVRAVQHPYASILGHLTGRLLLRRPPYEVDVMAVLAACAEAGTVVEINANPRRLDLDWRLVARAKALGCRFAIDPDAHHVDGYHDLRYGVLMARKAGLSAIDVVNTAPDAGAFLARLKPSRAPVGG
ncbi:DNA polymerase/3'-5' exonuclease PolX [Truepera radiovictrix]|uniref:DNA-directed DNA polymerase n=1 Tax=Truepera radiovictrix (strain DSM 17093 / CIP 108686 / LMG 22925 / RQ-24) TaxID=649638 RepID=D7CTP6_TRURR|nr:DNA polymerase/3'-5' exonuclease PolX [Truepera radiovictrix]ADI15593.1 PHP domain protein [Truepera radiovictrix DSM 17093]WMT58778.1 PHP domain-containing protein [Truepera radiovictrix]